MTEADKKEASRKTAIAASAVHVVDAVDLGAIFYMVGSEALKMLFEQSLRFFMLPVAAIANIFQAGLAIRQALLNKHDGHLAARAAVETIGAVAITTAVTAGLTAALLGSTLFIVIAPVIFMATFAMKTLFNLGSAIYFGVKAARASDPAEKYEYRKKAIESGVGAAVGMMLTATIAAVMLFAKPAMAIMGVIGGAILATISVLKCLDLANKKPDSAPPPATSETDDEFDYLTNNAELQKVLNAKKSPTAAAPLNGIEPGRPLQPNESATHESAALLLQNDDALASSPSLRN